MEPPPRRGDRGRVRGRCPCMRRAQQSRGAGREAGAVRRPRVTGSPSRQRLLPTPPRRPTCLLLTLEDSSNSSITEGPRTLSSAIHRFTDEKTQTLSVRGTRLRPHGKFVPGPGPHPRPSRPLPGATSPGSAALAAGWRLRPRRGLQRVGRTTDAPSRPPPARASPVRRTCLSRQLARDSAHHEFSPTPPRTPESLLFQS